jgi:hypothetical protein
MRASSGRLPYSPRIIAGLRTCQSARRCSTTTSSVSSGIRWITHHFTAQSASAMQRAMITAGFHPRFGS